LFTESGGTDPKLNRQLARVLDEGKSNKVPNATMFEALRKMVCNMLILMLIILS